MKLFAMAVVAGLPAFETLAVSSAAGGSNPAIVNVKCDTTGTRQRTTVTAPGTTLQVTCPTNKYTVEPAAGKAPETQQVYADAQCKDMKALTFYCPSASGKSSPQSGIPGVALTIPTLPRAPRTFYLQCKATAGGTADKNCLVEVLVKNAVAGGQRQAREGASGEKGSANSAESADSASPSGPAGPQGPSGGNKEQSHVVTPPPRHQDGGTTSEEVEAVDQQVQGGAEAPGETADVHICEAPKTNITIRILERGSSAKFACTSGFNLYPTQADKIYSTDCKNQETLKDMTRTQASVPAPPAAPGEPGSPDVENTGPTRTSAPTSEANSVIPATPAASPSIVYTLQANKKPPKKHLCYLCAKEGVSEAKPGTAGNYCTIYVESGARKQLRLELTFASMLPCVLAVLFFT